MAGCWSAEGKVCRIGGRGRQHNLSAKAAILPVDSERCVSEPRRGQQSYRFVWGRVGKPCSAEVERGGSDCHRLDSHGDG